MDGSQSWPRRPSLEWAYREWLFAEAKREADSGCVRLLGIKSRIATLFREVTRGWEADATCDLMRVNIKQTRYLSIQPLPLSADEASLAASFQWPILKWSTPGRPQVVIDYPWRPNFAVDVDKEEVARLDLRIAQGEFRVPKPLIRKHFRQALKPLLGSPWEASGEARYWTPLDGVTVETAVRFTPGGVGQCEYWHRVLPGHVDKTNQVRPGEELLLRCSISDLFGVHVTDWDCMTEADVPTQAALLSQLVESFLKAAPGIVAAAVAHDAADAG